MVNTIAGLESVDAGVREAANGMGLSLLQNLLKVELLLAATIIFARIRTTAIINVGTQPSSAPRSGARRSAIQLSKG
jgi:osmoprotectant transport system permease protein